MNSYDDIIAQSEKILDLVKENEDFITYQSLYSKIKNNIEIQEVEKRIKELQKQAVNLEYYGKAEMLNVVELEILELNELLRQKPLYNEYINALIGLDELIQTITKNIEDCLNKL